jgi:hypothetical protein
VTTGRFEHEPTNQIVNQQVKAKFPLDVFRESRERESRCN